MITLRIDDQTYALWRERAAERGLSVEDWLKTETAGRRPGEHPEAGGTSGEAPALSADAWTARLRAFAARHRPTGHPLDDSRESIYD